MVIQKKPCPTLAGKALIVSTHTLCAQFVAYKGTTERICVSFHSITIICSKMSKSTIHPNNLQTQIKFFSFKLFGNRLFLS